jgi:hypothetical protein
MTAKVDGFLEALQRREGKLAARKDTIRQLRQQVRERNAALAKLKDGRRADDGREKLKTGYSPEDAKERKADDELKDGQKAADELKDGQKADDEREKLNTGRSPEDTKERKADDKCAKPEKDIKMANSDRSADQGRFDFEVVRTGVRSEEHLDTRRRILARPAPQMNKGTDLWMAAMFDEYYERLQQRRNQLAAQKDKIQQLRQLLRERNAELAKLEDGRRADDGREKLKTGCSPEDTKERKADNVLKDGQKADDEREKLNTGRSPEDTKERKADDERAKLKAGQKADDERAKLKAGQKADDERAKLKQGRSPEDTKERKADDERAKLKEGQKADDERAKLKEGRSLEDTKERNADDDELAHGEAASTGTKFKRLTRFHRS